MHSGILFALTVLLGHLSVSNGVKCYSCTFSTVLSDRLNSNTNCDEGSAFNAQNLTDHLQTTECSGKCSKLRGSANGIRTINRSCSTSCTESNVAGQGYFCCSTDYCNDTWRVKASLVGALVSVLAAYLLRA